MKNLCLLFLLSLVFSCLGCSREVQGTSSKVVVESTVRFESDDGDSVEKPISFESMEGVEGLRKTLGNKSGRFVLTTKAHQVSDTIESRIEGRLENGSLEGPARTYLVVGGRQLLSAEAFYRNDVQQGVWKAFYPTLGRVQIVGNFEAGKKEGEFVTYYSNGTAAVRMAYSHDVLDGSCVVYDKSGSEVVSGVYELGVEKNGTFVEDLNLLIRQVVDDHVVSVKVASISQTGQPPEFSVRTFNDRRNP